MLSLEMEEQLKKTHQLSLIIWAVIMASVIFYGGFVYILQSSGPHSFFKGDILKQKDMLVLVLGIVSFSSAFISFFVKNFMASPEKIITKIKAGMVEKSPSGIAGCLRASLIVTLALREAIAIYGLFLFFISSDYQLFLYFAVPALFLELLAYPSYDSWRETVEEVLSQEPKLLA